MKNHLNSPQCNCLFRKIIFLDLTKSECFLMISRKLESSKPCEKLLLRMYGLFQMILVSCISNISPLKDQIILNEFYLHWQRPLKAQQETKIKKWSPEKPMKDLWKTKLWNQVTMSKKLHPKGATCKTHYLSSGWYYFFCLFHFTWKSLSVIYYLCVCQNRHRRQSKRTALQRGGA